MKNHLRFTKMHALGNDFVVIQSVNAPFEASQLPIAKLADRHRGIGFDQLLVIEPSSKADFFCRIFNADGSEAEQCGNGLRCVARFIHEQGLSQKSPLLLETKAGVFTLQVQDFDHICVTLGAPEVKEHLVELTLNSQAGSIPISILSLGNPHAIVKVDAVDLVSADQLGSEISSHVRFPQGANVGFMQILDASHIRLRTFERGVGETYACGSNACAAAVAGIANGWLAHRVNVGFRYGSLLIEWEGGQSAVRMTGPASNIFSGEITLSHLDA